MWGRAGQISWVLATLLMHECHSCLQQFIFEILDVCTEQKILGQLLTSMYRNLENIVSVITFISYKN